MVHHFIIRSVLESKENICIRGKSRANSQRLSAVRVSLVLDVFLCLGSRAGWKWHEGSGSCLLNESDCLLESVAGTHTLQQAWLREASLPEWKVISDITFNSSGSGCDVEELYLASSGLGLSSPQRRSDRGEVNLQGNLTFCVPVPFYLCLWLSSPGIVFDPFWILRNISSHFCIQKWLCFFWVLRKTILYGKLGLIFVVLLNPNYSTGYDYIT